MIFIDSELQNKIVIVTGGSRGIGRAIVESFAQEGSQVIFFYHRNQDLAESVVDQARENDQKVIALQVDTRNKSECEAAIEKIIDEFQRIDILINNSGVIDEELFAGISLEKIRDLVDTNIQGTFFVTQAVLPSMIIQKSGKIISLSSVAGEKGGRGQTVYAATKGAINAWTKALAVELASKNITVNAVAPGAIETDMTERLRNRAGDVLLSKILLQRFGKPVEVAHAVLFLASRFANYITGEILHVDGGFKMA